VKVATAEYYIRLLSENVKKGQKEKLSQGWLPTKPPLGYKTMASTPFFIHFCLINRIGEEAFLMQYVSLSNCNNIFGDK